MPIAGLAPPWACFDRAGPQHAAACRRCPPVCNVSQPSLALVALDLQDGPIRRGRISRSGRSDDVTMSFDPLSNSDWLLVHTRNADIMSLEPALDSLVSRLTFSPTELSLRSGTGLGSRPVPNV